MNALVYSYAPYQCNQKFKKICAFAPLFGSFVELDKHSSFILIIQLTHISIVIELPLFSAHHFSSPDSSLSFISILNQDPHNHARGSRARVDIEGVYLTKTTCNSDPQLSIR